MKTKAIIEGRLLSGKTVVITGASSGVGMAAAHSFAKAGAKLVIAARRAEALEATAAECRALGAEVLTVIIDVRHVAAMRSLAEQAVQFGGSIDIWVNNAGVLAAGAFDETPYEIHEAVIQTNLLGYMNGAYAVLPYFKKHGYGTIINNISIGGFIPLAYAGAYSASKFGLRGFTNALRAELSPWKDIHVCSLYPAFLDTPGLEHAANFTGASLELPPAFLLKPERVANAMVRLAVQPADYVYSDAIAPVMRANYSLMPRLIDRFAEGIMRKYFKNSNARVAPKSGNVLETDEGGTGVRATRKEQNSSRSSLRTVGLIAGGLLAGMLLLKGRE